MKLLDRFGDWFVGNVSFPLTSDLMNRRGVLRTYRDMIASEHRTQEEQHEIQFRKLQIVLRHAYDYCSFYKQRFNEAGITPDDIRTPDDLRNLRPLSRRDVIQRGDDMVDARYADSIRVAQKSGRGPGQPIPFSRFRHHQLVRNTSSGSTGAPVTFYEDGSTTAANWALELRVRYWFGFDPGVREARMARVSADYVPGGAMNWMRRRLWHQLMLPGVNLADNEYAIALQKIRAFRPRILWGFTSALVGFADYIKRIEADISMCRPELAIGWAAPVYEHEERTLREVFGCAVTNIYGAREVGHIAALCPEHSWHINQEHVLLECNNDDSVAERGEILVTVLDPSPMPFIRYRLGDVGRPAPADCRCGRTLSVIKDFLGRTGEIFKTKDGRMIAPNFWCRFFMVDGQSQFVERFQVIYRKSDEVDIRIVKKQGFSEQTEADMLRILRRNFSDEIHFRFNYVPKIEPQISGKYQMVVNECRG